MEKQVCDETKTELGQFIKHGCICIFLFIPALLCIGWCTVVALGWYDVQMINTRTQRSLITESNQFEEAVADEVEKRMIVRIHDFEANYKCRK